MSDACAATSFSCLACTPQLSPSTGQAHHSNHMDPIHSRTIVYVLGLTYNLQIFVLKRLLSTRAAHPLVHEHPISPTSVTVPITPQLFSCCSCKSCSTIMQQLWKVKLVTHNYAVMQVCEISNHSIDVEWIAMTGKHLAVCTKNWKWYLGSGEVGQSTNSLALF